MHPYNPELTTHARTLRSNMTEAEQRLWFYLRRQQILGQTFNRQKPLGRYIADFYCSAARLVVELDGSQHVEPQHARADRERDAYLSRLGLQVLRFDNRQVLFETQAVVAVIWQVVVERTG